MKLYHTSDNIRLCWNPSVSLSLGSAAVLIQTLCLNHVHCHVSLLRHSKKVLGSILGPFCVEVACSPHVHDANLHLPAIVCV